MAAHTGMIGIWLAALSKSKQDVNKKRRPPDEQGGHEPATKPQDGTSRVTGGGRFWRLPQNSVDQREVINSCLNLPRSIPDGPRPACAHGPPKKTKPRQSRL